LRNLRLLEISFFKLLLPLVLDGGPEGKDHLEYLIVDGRILQWVFKNWAEEAWTGLIWHRIGKGGGRL